MGLGKKVDEILYCQLERKRGKINSVSDMMDSTTVDVRGQHALPFLVLSCRTQKEIGQFLNNCLSIFSFQFVKPLSFFFFSSFVAVPDFRFSFFTLQLSFFVVTLQFIIQLRNYCETFLIPQQPWKVIYTLVDSGARAGEKKKSRELNHQYFSFFYLLI